MCCQVEVKLNAPLTSLVVSAQFYDPDTSDIHCTGDSVDSNHSTSSSADLVDNCFYSKSN